MSPHDEQLYHYQRQYQQFAEMNCLEFLDNEHFTQGELARLACEVHRSLLIQLRQRINNITGEEL